MSLSSVTPAVVNPWQQILSALEKKISRHSFDTWFKPTRFDRADGNKLYIKVPTPEFRQLDDKFGDLIGEAMESLGLSFEEVHYIAEEAAPARRPDGSFTPASSHAPNAPRSQSTGSGQVVQQRFDWDTAAQLNPKYTFTSFVIGAQNQMAKAA